MVYDRGNGDEEKFSRKNHWELILKKVEIKNIKETSLISVDDQGLETDRSLLSETPSDVKPYYLKVLPMIIRLQKLAVDKIEEVTVDGATLYSNSQSSWSDPTDCRSTSLVRTISTILRNQKHMKVMSTTISTNL